MWDAITKNYNPTLYSEEMTRFMIDIESAMDLIEQGLNISGYNIIAYLKSFKVKDLFEIYCDNFNIKYNIGKPRISEKLHEMMFSKEESTRIQQYNSNFGMHYKDVYNISLPFEEFTSDKVVVSKKELKSILSYYNYFKI